MKIKRICILIIIFILVSGGAVNAQAREPAVAGAFYPASPDILKQQIKEYLDEAGVQPKQGLIGLVAPHAGYPYSGGVAGYAFKLLEGTQYDTVVVLGTNHTTWGFNSVSVYNKGSYKTPLGEIPIDTQYADAIIKTGGFSFYPEVHKREHSIEVELPFLQVTLGTFKLVPIIVSDNSSSTCERLAKAILDNAGDRKILIVASSDFSHDKPYDKAVEMDRLGLDDIVNLDIDSLIKDKSSGRTEMCGYGGVLTLMYLAKRIGNVKGVLLKYANSGDVTGNKHSRIVGYGAVAFYKEKDIMKENSSNPYTAEEKKALLGLARNSIKDYLSTGKTGDYPVFSPKFEEDRGAFVTLHKHGQLRGCIGYIEPIKPLHQAVIDNAINAATKDYRFSRVDIKELPDIEIEISVLTPPEEIKGPEEFIVGKHGIIIRKGFRSAVFLPQVAPEQGWGMEETLSHLCMKAGLSPDEWKKPGMKFFVFTADVFGEKE